MTKDQLIAYLSDRLAKAEAELDRIRQSARVRQSRHRHVTVADGVTLESRDVSRAGHVTVTFEGDIGGETSPLPGVTEGTDPEDKAVDRPTTGGSRGAQRDSHVTDAAWLAFREAYPKLTRRTNWNTTYRRWSALSKADREAALVGAEHYAPSRDVLRSGEKGAQSWLNERCWESWQEPEPPLPSTNGNGHRPTETVGEARLRQWRESQDGQDACLEGEVVR